MIYEHYADPGLAKFEHLVRETDRFDSAHLTRGDVTDALPLYEEVMYPPMRMSGES